MTEHYYWWWNGVKRLSRAEIRKMKENMQKTPLVQEKANKYHRLEEEKAEKTEWSETTTDNIPEEKTDNLNYWENLSNNKKEIIKWELIRLAYTKTE